MATELAGSEHVLLALLRFRRGCVVRVLHAAGLQPEDIEAELARQLGRSAA